METSSDHRDPAQTRPDRFLSTFAPGDPLQPPGVGCMRRSPLNNIIRRAAAQLLRRVRPPMEFLCVTLVTHLYDFSHTCGEACPAWLAHIAVFSTPPMRFAYFGCQSSKIPAGQSRVKRRRSCYRPSRQNPLDPPKPLKKQRIFNIFSFFDQIYPPSSPDGSQSPSKGPPERIFHDLGPPKLDLGSFFTPCWTKN